MLNSLQSCWMPRSDESRSSWSGIGTVATTRTGLQQMAPTILMVAILLNRSRLTTIVNDAISTLILWPDQCRIGVCGDS